MSKAQQVTERDPNEIVVDRARDFWTRNQRLIIIISSVIIVLVGGYLGWKNFVKEPNEKKAEDAVFKAEEYYRMDSLQKALNGDMVNAGFLKVISKYGGTEAANRARFYAGDCLLRTGEFAKAEKYLKDFKTDAEQIQSVAYKLTADALSEQDKKEEAVSYYKKAAHTFETDKVSSAQYLLYAGLLLEDLGKTKEAIAVYKEIKEKFPANTSGVDADKYLARLGEYN